MIGIPALEMLDDIINIQDCGVISIKFYALINTFIEHKKFEMGQQKCNKIHCGKKSNSCPDFKVHKKTMHNSDEEKCLGD